LHSDQATPVEIDSRTMLNGITTTKDVLSKAGLELVLNWSVQGEREFFPWMFLKLTPRTSQPAIVFPRGLCGPEWTAGPHQEIWRITANYRIPPGEYQAEAVFVDYAKLLWTEKTAPRNAQSLNNAVRVPLGEIKIAPSDSSEK
jgi:hypothetical protein